MTAPTKFQRGRYVRSYGEAEQLAAKNPKIVSAMRGRGGSPTMQSTRRLTALMAIAAIRRGYVPLWGRLFAIAVQKVLEGLPVEPDGANRLVGDLVDQRGLDPEPDREATATEWASIAGVVDEGDEFETLLADPTRASHSLRWWGMQNRAMRNKLERGECVDLAGCARTTTGYYIVPADVWQDDVDYCDGDREAWIWSVGRDLRNGLILASTAADLYQNPNFECLFLR